MKWLALIILILNLGFWFAGDLLVPDRVNRTSGSQTLPRVVDLKVAEKERSDSGAAAPPFSAGVEMPASVPEVDPPPEPELEPIERMCVQIGWFDSAEAASAAVLPLGVQGASPQVVEQERDLEPLHWVIVPPQPEAQALEQFRDLQRRGIDSYLVTRGENKNAISLGLFQYEDAAERVLERKKRQNLNAVLAKFPRNQISYALVFEAGQAMLAGDQEARIRDYRNDFDLVEIGPCEGVATIPENP